jgi:hypothetical protein
MFIKWSQCLDSSTMNDYAVIHWSCLLCGQLELSCSLSGVVNVFSATMEDVQLQLIT